MAQAAHQHHQSQRKPSARTMVRGAKAERARAERAKVAVRAVANQYTRWATFAMCSVARRSLPNLAGSTVHELV